MVAPLSVGKSRKRKLERRNEENRKQRNNTKYYIHITVIDKLNRKTSFMSYVLLSICKSSPVQVPITPFLISYREKIGKLFLTSDKKLSQQQHGRGGGGGMGMGNIISSSGSAHEIYFHCALRACEIFNFISQNLQKI